MKDAVSEEIIMLDKKEIQDTARWLKVMERIIRRGLVYCHKGKANGPKDASPQ